MRNAKGQFVKGSNGRPPRNREKVLCSNCKTPTENPKFCSRSCSATITNQTAPKRSLEGMCGCGTPIRANTTYCKSCWNQKNNRQWEETTLEQLRGEGNAVRGGRYPYIRTLARRLFIQSGRELRCVICGYDIHVDIAHVKAVSDFPESATVSEVNDITNLVALCRNHHWEYDHGHISLNCG